MSSPKLNDQHIQQVEEQDEDISHTIAMPMPALCYVCCLPNPNLNRCICGSFFCPVCFQEHGCAAERM